ncbi:MAG: LL-diaminopimelate aminotransferase [Candidatus Aenigmarchaeota archaeon]|nr:LL-diaminopimelate aminotransferase [Candidatus Aenigmarchaeota archaeon]
MTKYFRSGRLKQIPPYLFAEISRKIARARKSGIDVISLGIGDPDMPTPKHIIAELERAANDPKNHRYPDYEGLLSFRQAVSDWYKKRHNVSLDAAREVLALIGSKEGSLHLSLAFINPGDYALVPNPSYTTYRTATILANGFVHDMPLVEDNDFLPQLDDVPKEIAEKTKILYVSYPNNPTTAVAEKEFYKAVIDFARDNNIIVCSDNPYSEIAFDGYRPLSFLEVEGAKDVGVEFNSLSKPYNMTGWRIGMAVGNEEIISAIATVKNNVDSGVFNAVQYAGITALLNTPESDIAALNSVYQRRRDLAYETLTSVGIKARKPKATFYMWCRVPENHTSASFATLMLEKAGVVVTPGSAYGIHGEGYFRISLTVPDARLEEAMARIKKTMA